MFIELLEFVVLANLIIFGALIGCSLSFGYVAQHCAKCICLLLFLNPSSPHYNPSKVLLIVLCTLHSSGGEFEFCQIYGRLHIWNES